MSLGHDFLASAKIYIKIKTSKYEAEVNIYRRIIKE